MGSVPGVSDLDRALDVLLDARLAPIVDMVARRVEGRVQGGVEGGVDDLYEVASAEGAVTFRRTGPGPDGYERTGVSGADPLAEQSPDRLVGLDAERADPHPPRATNSYPYAFDHVAQLFDHPAAPDLCVLHSAAHNWEGQGGHRGEHGSLGIVQARAPFVVAGKGVRNDGLVPRAGRLVDVAPTIAELLECAPDEHGCHLAGQDGEV